MKKITMKKRTVLLAAAFLLSGVWSVSTALAVTVSVEPARVDINLGYHGTTLKVTGENAAGDELIIRISDAAADAHYKYIGKAGGVFWMKKGDIAFKNVPGVYLLFTSREMEKLVNADTMRQNLIGYEALKAAAEMEAESDELKKDEDRWKSEFIKFKEKEKLYGIRTGAVIRRHGQKSDTYSLEVSWPYQAVPGNYTVEVMAVRDGRIAERSKAQFSVARAGIVSQLTELAFNRSAIYGIMAVVIAIIAGFAVGMVFKKGGGAH